MSEAPEEPQYGGEIKRGAAPEVIATNTGVRLACTMAAMIGLLGVFLCWAEKESRVIRRYAVQSAVLTAVHAIAGAVLIITGGLLGAIPYFGFLVTLMCWLIYIAVLVALAALRIRLMERAWHGLRYELPALESISARYY